MVEGKAGARVLVDQLKRHEISTTHYCGKNTEVLETKYQQ